MTAADLEALAERLTLGEYTTADLHAAARCARGWAKLGEILKAEDGWAVDLWRTSKGHIRMLSNKQSCDGPTALETVEAAEVTR